MQTVESLVTSDTSWEHAHELVAVGMILSPVAFESLCPKENEMVNVKEQVYEGRTQQAICV